MKLKIFLYALLFCFTGIIAVPDVVSLPRKLGEMGSDFDLWAEYFENWQWWNYGLLVIALIFLVCIIYVFLSWYLITKETPIQHLNPLQANDREFTKASAKEIFDDLDNLISIKEEERAKFYLDKWLRVQGVIDDISQLGAEVTISFSGRFLSFRSVDMKFSDESTCARLRTLDRGIRLAVVGKITYASSLSISLTDCELVENSPNDDKLK